MQNHCAQPASHLSLDFPPYQLSGLVLGVLMNHRPALQAIGERVHLAPYKSPPVAPVLYVKPRNTLHLPGTPVPMDADVETLEVGASLGLIIGRPTFRVRASEAMLHVAGFTIATDLSVPHTSYYRPSVRFKARDHSCLLGPLMIARAHLSNPDDLGVSVWVNNQCMQRSHTADRQRSAAQLISDISEFMTLNAGDIVMLGASADAPLVSAGQKVRVDIEGLGRQTFSLHKQGDAA